MRLIGRAFDVVFVGVFGACALVGIVLGALALFGYIAVVK